MYVSQILLLAPTLQVKRGRWLGGAVRVRRRRQQPCPGIFGSLLQAFVTRAETSFNPLIYHHSLVTYVPSTLHRKIEALRPPRNGTYQAQESQPHHQPNCLSDFQSQPSLSSFLAPLYILNPNQRFANHPKNSSPFPNAHSKMATPTLNVEDLFSVKDLVAVITGGGTGEFASLSLPFPSPRNKPPKQQQ